MPIQARSAIYFFPVVKNKIVNMFVCRYTLPTVIQSKNSISSSFVFLIKKSPYSLSKEYYASITIYIIRIWDVSMTDRGFPVLQAMGKRKRGRRQPHGGDPCHNLTVGSQRYEGVRFRV